MTDNVVVGKCPLCGNDVHEKEKLFVCSTATRVKNETSGEWENQGCEFKIFKTALNKLGKEKIEASEVETLLNNGVVEVELVSKKTGKPYKANGVVDPKYGIKIDFTAFEQK